LNRPHRIRFQPGANRTFFLRFGVHNATIRAFPILNPHR
jgi:hypothetical protein